MSNYRGSIVSLIFKALEAYPEMSVGEVLYTILNRKALKKNVVEATDEDIYTAIEKILAAKEESDEPMTEEEFKGWISKL